MNFVAVAIVSAIVIGPPFNKTSRLLIDLNCILLCLNNSNKIAKQCDGFLHMNLSFNMFFFLSFNPGGDFCCS